MADTDFISVNHKVFFPADFKPGVNHVIVGRGKKCYKHVGNEKLRSIVGSKLEEYSAATCKTSKSSILMSIITELRTSTPKGGFIKEDPHSKMWYDVGDFLAREKISQAFRDALHGNYKSSQKNKKKRTQGGRTHTSPPVVVKRMRPASPLTESDLSELLMSEALLDSDDESWTLNESLAATLNIGIPSNCHAKLPSSGLLQYDDPFEPTPFYEPDSSSVVVAPSSSKKVGGWTMKMVDQLTPNNDNWERDFKALRGTSASPNICVARQA